MAVTLTVDESETVNNDRGYRIFRTGLVITVDLSKRLWEDVGQRLMSMESGLQWAIGDWLVYGTSCGHQDQNYSVAQHLTGKTLETLSQYARVSVSYHIEERDARCSWSIYRLALTLDYNDRMKALKKAADERWTQRDFVAFARLRGGVAVESDAQNPSVPSERTTRQSSTRDEAPVLARSEDVGLLKSSRYLAKPGQQQVTCPECGHHFHVSRP